MDKMVVEEIDTDINAIRDSIRSTDEQIGTLSGRLPRHQRISYADSDEPEPMNTSVDRKSFGLDDRRISMNRDYKRDSTGGAIRRRISTVDDRLEPKRGFAVKRQRTDYQNDDDDVDDEPKRSKKTIQSTVIMPALDSKGREEKIEKLKESENKDVKNRNRRLFSNLLIGTLTNFKKSERKTTQQEKQELVEKKLEESKKKEEEIRSQEKNELLKKRREQERELHNLQRKKALIQYAEINIKQLKNMKGAIKTSFGPSIYWQPAKHTVRSMELQQSTERYIDDLIKKREDQLKEDLEAKERKNENDDDDDDHENGEDEYDDGGKEEIEVVVDGSEIKRDIKIENEKNVGNGVEEEEEEEEEEEVHVELD
ncbi:unnamed protein product [Caenorhabditis bovis]|uniref:Pinin/SDK/MemA protein domain-containing protein n=1 Tax=Caenorhabditis bovis TaxID=2654633 RepID=A0A8S1EGP8_9PELO|nr:unnamed protein product [Caenorhabditis bovis]